MGTARVIIGASGHDDSRARSAARRLRDDGLEVVFVGGDQAPEQLARTAVAEDSARIIVDVADPSDVDRLVQACEALGAGDIVVEPLV